MTGGPVVGPVPPGADPDAYDRRRRRVLWSLPTGLYVLGSRSGERRNLMTLNWAMQVATDPKAVAVSVEKEAVTHQLISQGEGFALSILAREERTLVRKFVKPLPDGGEPGTLDGHEVFVASSGSPILAAAATWVDCTLTGTHDCGSHTLFVGTVLDCGPAVDGLDVLRMEDTRMNYGG